VTVTSTAIGSTATLTVNVSNPTDFAWTTTGSVSGSNGSNTCTGTTGTYAYSATAATLAGNIAAALSAAGCSGLGITAVQGNGSNGGSTTQVVVTENTPGTFTTLSGGVANATNIFSWAAASAGTNGTAPACSSATSGSYVTDSSTTNLAANLAAAINLCNTNFPNNVLATANNNSSSTATITASINGTFVLTTATGTNAAMLTIGAPTGGGNGTNACTGSGPWTANFATSATLTTIAADVTSAINACTLGSKGVAAAGNAVVSTTALGTGASLTVGASNNTNIFSWSGVTAGTDGTNSSTTFAYWSVNNYLTPAQVAANIATAVNANTTLQGSTGVSATVSGNDVIFMARVTGTGTFGVTAGSFSAFTPGTLTGGAAATAGKVQPNAYPAKFSFSTAAASCSNDFVVYPTGVAGATGASTIIAYNNLYTSGCSGQVPSVYWEYNTGTGSAVTTSPVLSFFDNTGSQVAFIQVYSGVASLVLLKSAPSTSGTPTTQTAANYPTCTAPCMYTAAFGNGKNDTLSAPFYDYAGDAIYVGDDSGNLHKFTGVFNGAPAEAGGNWPVPLGTNKLSSPVYDATSGHVFVGDMGGELYYVTSDGSTHSPFMAGSPLAALVLGNAIADAPLVDSTKEQVFAFVGSSGTYSWNTYSAVYQSNTNLNAQYPAL
jgi:hypothetical protein